MMFCLNSFKNEVVKASGYKYIDFASAVGATEQGSPWLAGMLSGDGEKAPDYEFAIVWVGILAVSVIVAGIYDRNKEK